MIIILALKCNTCKPGNKNTSQNYQAAMNVSKLRTDAFWNSWGGSAFASYIWACLCRHWEVSLGLRLAVEDKPTELSCYSQCSYTLHGSFSNQLFYASFFVRCTTSKVIRVFKTELSEPFNAHQIRGQILLSLYKVSATRVKFALYDIVQGGYYQAKI